jgi:simple sugar transport system ATP-binding protein
VGEIHALLGENGAGKSTLSSIMTGLYRPDAGEIWAWGERVAFGSPGDALAAGIGMVHQHFRLADSLTVAENVVLGHRGGLGFSSRATEREVAALAGRYRMPVAPDARIWQLSAGEQQRVEILKALYRGVRLLILDEPTALLTPQESAALFDTMRNMAASGRALVFISHKLEEVLAVSDRVTVLRRGRWMGTVAGSATSARELAGLMVGRSVVEQAPDTGARPAPGGVLLDVDGVHVQGDRGTPALRGVHLQVRSGEILGVAGVAGNGQRELAEVITGLRRPASGRVVLEGRPLRPGDTRNAIDRGLGHVPEDRLGTGLAPGLSVADNLALKSYRRRSLSAFGILRRRAMTELAGRLMAEFAVVAPAPGTPVRLLSGGNLQKVVLARELSGSPRVLVAASPTRGLDVAATLSVRGLLLAAAASGVGVLLLSEDLDEILAVADRIAVIYEGRIVDVVSAAEAEVDRLGLMMAGAG